MGIEQIKEITSDDKVDGSEIKKLDENLKTPENKAAFKEALKQTSSEGILKLSNSILNYFKDNLNIVTLDTESKTSFKNVIGFLSVSYNIAKINLGVSNDLKTLKNSLTNPSLWIIEETKKDPKFLEEKIFPLLSLSDMDSKVVDHIESKFTEQLINIRYKTIENKLENKEGYFQNILNILIEKKYIRQLSDKDLINNIKDNFLQGLEPKDIQKIKNEIKNEIKSKSTQDIKKIFNNNYNSISPYSKELTKFADRSENLQKEYKKNIIKSKMEIIMEEELLKFLRNPEDIKTTKEDFLQYIKKEVDKYEPSKIGEIYNTINDENKFGSEFRRKIGEHLGEEIAEINRQSIKNELQLFENSGYTGDKSLIRTFEDMLSDTDAKSINNMAYILAKYPAQKNTHIKNILDKISKQKIENCKKFSNVKISSFVDQTKIEKFKTDIQKSNKTTSYKTIIKQEMSEYFDESNLLSLLTQYNKNSSIDKITINIPEGKEDIYAGVQKQINLIAQGDQNIINKFDIKTIGGINKIKITSLESKETKGSINLELQKLDANMIGDPIKIAELLSQNPQMKEFIDNPNYTLNGGEIIGTASKNRTNYQQKFSESNTQGLKITKERSNAQIQENNEDLTNNPGLAYDRAYSFLDYFLRTKKVDNQTDNKDSEFKIKYNVDGPTREELVKSLKEKNGGTNPTNQDLLEAFKEYQKASIKLDFTKNEKISKDLYIDIQEKELVQGLEVYISGDEPSGGGRKPRFPNLGLRIGGGRSLNLDPRRFNKCATFN